MPFSPTLAEVLQSHKDTLLDEIWTAIPATIVSLAAPGFVNVQPLIRNPLLDEFGNVGGSEVLPSISNVPLAIVRGGGAFISVPVIPGDHVMLIFSKHSMDTYRVAGESPADPGWVGKHTYDSCVAFPCIAPDVKAPVDISLTDVVIGFDGTPNQIHVSPAGISLGKAATEHVAIGEMTDANFAALITTISSVAAGIVAAPDGGKAAFLALATALAAAFPTVSSTVVSTL